jgi:prophage tail gpP-like protein
MANEIELPEVVVEPPDVPRIELEPRRILRPWPRPELEPKLEETATLIVAGRRFEDWETVWVQDILKVVPSQFRFTAAERDPIPNWWELLQFKPGDLCEVYLGGELALTGVILIRQVAADGKQHGVVLQGVAGTWAPARSSILHKTGAFEGSFLSIASQVLALVNGKFKVQGTIDPTPYKPPAHNEPGETAYSFLERIGRDRKVLIGGNAHGDFVFIGQHAPTVQDRLIEGVNILKMQVVISDTESYSKYVTRGQTARSDEGSPKDAAEQEATTGGVLKQYSSLLTVMEHPVWTPKEVALRNDTEAMLHDGQRIEATITVQGWFTSHGNLWQTGKNVMVQSRMAMLNMELIVESVTFAQDSRAGSTTTLVLKQPWALNGEVSYSKGPEAPPPEKSKPILPGQE